jgi:hypothetical protein
MATTSLRAQPSFDMILKKSGDTIPGERAAAPPGWVIPTADQVSD